MIAAATIFAANITAQESDFSLDSQRSEKQDVLAVPGHRINHHGLVINPTPHKMDIDATARLDASLGFAAKGDGYKFKVQLEKAGIKQNSKGKPLDIQFGAKAAKKAGVAATSGAYALTVDKRGVKICGFDERGAFYGIQTLRQILCSEIASDGQIPYISINDYPNLPNRGVVEGFYGTPWSHDVRLSLIDFYGKFKMCTYLYGPKDDPYHSCPNWRLPYPEKEAEQIKQLVNACKENYVDFVWAIHPGQDIKWNEDDYNKLVGKFNMMYDLGVRSFAIFFDDISGEGTNPEKQVELLNRLTKEFVEAKGDVAGLTVCPTDYSRLWANPSPQGSLAIYGNKLHPSIKIFWTGDVVCSDLTADTMHWLNQRIKRPGYYWWNFPVTDYARHIIMQGPTYGLDGTLSDKDLCGLVSNPMEHGEASKLALYGVADYTWNIANYNALDNWERGLKEMAPDAYDAYRTFAIHSCDTETGYRRDESWETSTFSIDNFTQPQYDALYDEFSHIVNVEATMNASCKNKQLLNELNPWLKQFTLLGKRGIKALQLIKLFDNSQPEVFWKEYVGNLMNNEQTKTYEAHKCGTMKLQPFYENTMDRLAEKFFFSLTSKQPSTLKGIGSFPTLRTTQSKLMLDGNTSTYYHSGKAQSKDGGDWFGVDLGKVSDVWEINILQGRNSTDDVDYFDHACLEYSIDGSQWTPLIADIKNQYDISWKGNNVKAKYIRMRKLASEKTNWVAVRSFEVNPPSVNTLGFKLKADNASEALRAFDNHPGTSFACNGAFSFSIPNSRVTSYIILSNLTDGASASISQFDSKGHEIANDPITEPYTQVTLAKDAKELSLKGNIEIFEIIAHE